MKLKTGLAYLVGLLAVAVSTGDELKFVVMGDWGGQDTFPFYTVAEKEVHMQCMYAQSSPSHAPVPCT